MLSDMTMSNAVGRRIEVGGTIDSWCGKCKRVLAHTIEAMVGDRPARVHCNTCNAQHAYKPDRPGPSAGREGKTPNIKKSAGTGPPRPYSARERYAPGDIVQHAVFGLGVAIKLKDENKVEVRFDNGTKLLMHAVS
jgi:hypothetical protein